jgi:hypothetical protein
MAVKLITPNAKQYIGLSTDTKPTGVVIGSAFWAYDTNITFITYDGTNWMPKDIKSIVLPGTIDLHQVAAVYDLYVATGGTVYVESFSLTLPDKDLTDDAALTGITVQTDTAPVITLVAGAAGLKALLTNNKVFTYSIPFALPVTKKIQLTIVGGSATDDPTTCIKSARYQAVTPAAYLV